MWRAQAAVLQHISLNKDHNNASKQDNTTEI